MWSRRDCQDPGQRGRRLPSAGESGLHRRGRRQRDLPAGGAPGPPRPRAAGSRKCGDAAEPGVGHGARGVGARPAGLRDPYNRPESDSRTRPGSQEGGAGPEAGSPAGGAPGTRAALLPVRPRVVVARAPSPSSCMSAPVWSRQDGAGTPRAAAAENRELWAGHAPAGPRRGVPGPHPPPAGGVWRTRVRVPAGHFKLFCDFVHTAQSQFLICKIGFRISTSWSNQCMHRPPRCVCAGRLAVLVRCGNEY